MIKSDRVLLHHTVGEGEYHSPIKPFWTTTSQFVIPTIEEALFGEFTRKPHHRTMSACIFQESIEMSRESIKRSGAATPFDFDLLQLSNACRGKTVLDALGSKGAAAPLLLNNPPAWTPRVRSLPTNLTNYTYWATVWIRINCTCALLEYVEDLKHVKATQFMNAHIPVIRYLDSLDDPSDEHINIHLLCSLYQRLGKSRFDEDRNLIRIETSKVQLRNYPLQILEKRFPDRIWRPNDVTSVNVSNLREAGYAINGMETNHFLMACLSIMVQCRDLHRVEEDMSVRDYLWFYHCCFLDVVGAGEKEVGTLVSQLLFPYDSRCFTGYDLPEAFHVLSSMPLWGEQLAPTFPLGKFIQKSLPFAGARRTLIDTTDKSISNADATFWKLFSSLFYCMLVDTYPEHISRNRKRCFDLQRLLSIVKLVGDRDRLKEMLVRKSFKTPENAATFNKENDKGCYIVFTAFRLWLLMIVHGQFHYQQAICDCLDWKQFTDETVAMADTIRMESDPSGIDTFAKPRETLKGAKNKIYRYRKSNVVDTVLGNMMEGLEKHLFKELDDWELRLGRGAAAAADGAAGAPPPIGIPTQSQFIARLVVTSLKYEIPDEIKTNLLNILIHVPKDMWIHPLTLSIMRLPEYGGITEFPIAMILKLIDIYFNNSAKPKDFEHYISLFDTGVEFKIISWFFHVLHILDGVDFELLLDSQVEQIDMAMMTTRYVLYPGQVLPKTAFNVFFTICCGKIKTLCGSSSYGHEDIAYDAIRRVYICAKGQKKVQSYNTDDMAFSEFERVKKQVRKQRKDFNFMPCKNNPVLCIDLRGFMLIWGRTARYTHCTQCAAFHEYKWAGWKGSEYKCGTCREKEQTFHTTCNVCGVAGVTMHAIVTNPLSVNGIGDIFQNLYFCKKHMPKNNNV